MSLIMLKYFNSFKKIAFRVETLQRYNVEEEKEAYKYFQQHKQLLDGFWKDWRDIVRQAKSRWAIMQRVHLIQFPISLYLLFEMEAYKKNIEAWEEIFYIPFEKCSVEVKSDFWIFDDSIVLKMNYDKDGRFVNFEEINDCSSYLQIKKILLENKRNIEELF